MPEKSMKQEICGRVLALLPLRHGKGKQNETIDV